MPRARVRSSRRLIRMEQLGSYWTHHTMAQYHLDPQILPLPRQFLVQRKIVVFHSLGPWGRTLGSLLGGRRQAKRSPIWLLLWRLSEHSNHRQLGSQWILGKVQVARGLKEKSWSQRSPAAAAACREGGPEEWWEFLFSILRLDVHFVLSSAIEALFFVHLLYFYHM